MAATGRERGFCSIEGCSRPHSARGYCHTHYARFRANGTAVPQPRECSLDGCKELYTPTRATQKFCCPNHAARASRGVGAAGPVATCSRDGCGQRFAQASGTHQYCSVACREVATKGRQAERGRAAGRRRRLRKYGLDAATYQRLLGVQQGRCAICGSDDPKNPRWGEWAIDHDHKTGKVRGLLCYDCNLGLGLFRDDPDRLYAAALYVDMHSAGELVGTEKQARAARLLSDLSELLEEQGAMSHG